MALYGRSDVVSVAVPPTSGGCGANHSRPVVKGVPLDEWDLEGVCIMCAATLKKDHDPLWSATVAEIPETPDEKLAREDAEKRGERAIKKAQEELSVRQHELTEKIVALLERKEIGSPPPGPYENAESLQEIVAREVAKALGSVQETIPVVTPGEIIGPAVTGDYGLERLHVRTLGKMCRDKGLDDKGGKADLIPRLLAAG